MNLLESYKGRLAVAESYYAKSHNGEKLSNNKKLVVAKLLENSNKFLNEAFENSVGTQRSDMGLFRKFTLNLTTVAVPNLIAFDLVYVYPMSSYNGYVTYIEYCAGSNKGATKQGDVFNSPFGLSPVDVNYTNSLVNESTTATATDASANKIALKWTPVVELKGVKVGGTAKTIVASDAVLAAGQCKLVDGEVVFYTGELTASAVVDTLYAYDNVVIPQNDLPLLTAELKGVSLVAHARRIAVYYSQMAAFQAKQDYGFDLGDQLAAQAVGRLSYEIDTEVVNVLVDNAPSDSDLVWSKTLPLGVSKQEHYAGFVEILEAAASKIFDRTQRFEPNFMIIASSIRQILAFVPGLETAPSTEHNGPYFFGTLNGIKIYVSPALKNGEFVLGVNNGTAEATAAIYAPYMPIVPTQLLNYADGAFSQGWSTLYDLKILNANLLIAGRVTA